MSAFVQGIVTKRLPAGQAPCPLLDTEAGMTWLGHKDNIGRKTINNQGFCRLSCATLVCTLCNGISEEEGVGNDSGRRAVREAFSEEVTSERLLEE